MKTLPLLIALLFASVASGQEMQLVSASAPLIQLEPDRWNAICELTCNNGRGGSGVLIKEDAQFMVLTAEHVVRGSTRVTVGFRNGRQLSSTRVFVNRDRSDSAVILIDDPGLSPVCLASSAPAPGETVLACGYGPEGQLLGQLNRIQGDSDSNTWMVGKIRSGDSGGPVFNAQGQVVGLNSTAAPPGAYGVQTTCCALEPIRGLVSRIQTQCPGGSCPPRYSQPRYSQPRGDVLPPGFSEAEPPRPSSPPPTPAPTPAQPAPIDYEKLASMVAAKIPKPADGKPGEPGATGPAGPQGPQGTPGQSGKDGKDADQTAHGFFYQVFDVDGSVIQPLTWMPVVPQGSPPSSDNTMTIKMFSRTP